LVQYIQAIRRQASILKEQLPFLCPDEDYIEKMLHSTEAIVILAKDKDTIVGVVGGWLEGTPSGYDIEDIALRQHEAFHEAHLDWMAVKEEYREKGIGTTLVERVCSWAKEKGKKKIWTETSGDAIAFYKKLGFKEISRFQSKKREQLVTMLKQL